MKRITCIGLSMLFSLTLVLPALGQGGENAAWQAIEDERDARRRAENLTDFIGKYPGSAHRPDADKMLVLYYNDNKDWAKIMSHADSFRLTQGSADAASKSQIFTQAMVAAATLNNMNKTVEFSNYALAADPNNLTVLLLLAGNNIPDPNKAMEYAQKAATVPRPATMADAQWQTLQGRVHSILGGFYLNKNQFKEASTELTLSVKANPKDHTTQYRAGFASANLAIAAAQAAKTANDELVLATTSKANPSTIAELTAKQAAFEKETLDHRDAAIESLARSLAIGGQFAPQAKQLLDGFYQSKNKSLDGEDQLIAQKKAELGL